MSEHSKETLLEEVQEYKQDYFRLQEDLERLLSGSWNDDIAKQVERISGALEELQLKVGSLVTIANRQKYSHETISLECLKIIDWIDVALQAKDDRKHEALITALSIRKNIVLENLREALETKDWEKLLDNMNAIDELIGNLQILNSPATKYIVKESIQMILDEVESFVNNQIVSNDKKLLIIIRQYNAMKRKEDEHVKDKTTISALIDDAYVMYSLYNDITNHLHVVMNEKSEAMLEYLQESVIASQRKLNKIFLKKLRKTRDALNKYVNDCETEHTNDRKYNGYLKAVKGCNGLIDQLAEFKSYVGDEEIKANISTNIDELYQLEINIVEGDRALLSIIDRYYYAKEEYRRYVNGDRYIIEFGIVSSLVNKLVNDTTLLMKTTTRLFTRECLKIIISELVVMQDNFKTDAENKMENYKPMDSLLSSLKYRIAVLESCAGRYAGKNTE